MCTTYQVRRKIPMEIPTVVAGAEAEPAMQMLGFNITTTGSSHCRSGPGGPSAGGWGSSTDGAVNAVDGGSRASRAHLHPEPLSIEPSAILRVSPESPLTALLRAAVDQAPCMAPCAAPEQDDDYDSDDSDDYSDEGEDYGEDNAAAAPPQLQYETTGAPPGSKDAAGTMASGVDMGGEERIKRKLSPVTPLSESVVPQIRAGQDAATIDRDLPCTNWWDIMRTSDPVGKKGTADGGNDVDAWVRASDIYWASTPGVGDCKDGSGAATGEGEGEGQHVHEDVGTAVCSEAGKDAAVFTGAAMALAAGCCAFAVAARTNAV